MLEQLDRAGVVDRLFDNGGLCLIDTMKVVRKNKGKST